MKTITDISVINLSLGFIVLIIPLAFLAYFRIRLIKDILISAIRMIIQLSLVALYLEWIFELNSAWLNSLWVLLMIFIGIGTSIKRVGLNWKFFLIPLFLAALSSVIIIDSFFLGLIVKSDFFFDARYFIPITGMVLGNSMNHNIVGLTAYFSGLTTKSELYYFLLTNSDSRKLSLRPYISDAFKKGLNPMIANMSVVGLISLPGMMTGQILGGSSPATAIKYQIMIMIAIFTGCSINLMLSILFSNLFVFDEYGNFRKKVIRKPF